MRLIDADAFIEYIKETSEELKSDKFYVDSGLTVKIILDAVIADLDGTSPDGFKRALTIEPELAKVEKQEKVYESSDHMFAYETLGECGNCGEPVKQGANYCSWCGMKLDWSNDEE